MRDYTELPEGIQRLVRQSDKERMQRLAEGTVAGYKQKTKAFLEFIKNQMVDVASEEYTFDERTPLIIRAFLSDLFAQGKAYSTLEGYKAAIKEYFSNAYGCNEGWRPGNVNDMGNPADDKEIAQAMDYYRKQSAKTRKIVQSMPIMFHHMAILHDFFNSNEPDELFTKQLKIQLDCMFSLAFVLMFRIDEVLSLRLSDIVQDLENEDAGVFYTSVKITFRKGNQDDSLASSVYQLYSVEKEEKIDARKKLKLYLMMLHNGQNINGSGFLFPKISGATIDLHSITTQQVVNSYLKVLGERLNLLRKLI